MTIYLVLSALCNVFAVAGAPVAVSPAKEIPVQEEEAVLYEDEYEYDDLEEEEGDVP